MNVLQVAVHGRRKHKRVRKTAKRSQLTNLFRDPGEPGFCWCLVSRRKDTKCELLPCSVRLRRENRRGPWVGRCCPRHASLEAAAAAFAVAATGASE